MARSRSRERRRASARRRVTEHETGGQSKYINLPEGYNFLRIKAGKYRMDFMSYVVTKGRGDDGGNPYFEEGELAYERTFFVHRGIGPNEEWHLCAAKTLNEPCPVCEYRAQLARDPNADEQLQKDLAPKERQLFIPVDLQEPDEKYLWEFSHHLFGRQLDAKIRDADEEDEYDFFADPVDGLTVRIAFNQSDAGKWLEATDIEFRQRKTQYAEDTPDDMPNLDELLVATPYDQLKRLFLQQDSDDDDQQEEKKSRRTRRSSKEKEKAKPTTAKDAGLEEGDRVAYKGDVCEIIRVSRDGTSLTLEDDQEEIFKGVGVDEVTKEEEEPKSGKGGASTAGKSSRSTKSSKSATDASPSDDDDNGDDSDGDDGWDDWE